MLDNPIRNPSHFEASPPSMTTESFDALIRAAEQARDAGRLSEAATMAAAALNAIPAPGPDSRCKAGQLLCALRYSMGDLSGALKVGLELLPLARERTPPDQLNRLLRALCGCAIEMGQFELALSTGREAHRVALDMNDPVSLVMSLQALGCLFDRIGDPAQAERLIGEALEVARGLDDEVVVLVLSNLCAVLIGNYYLQSDALPGQEALFLLRRAEPLAREALQRLPEVPRDPSFAVVVRGNLGETLLHLGQLQEARQQLQRALDESRRHGFQAQEWRIRCSMGLLDLAEGNPATAWETLHSLQLELGGEDGRMTLLRVHHGLWRAARAQGRSEQALQHLEAYLQLERTRSLMQLRGRSELLVPKVQADSMKFEAERHRERAQSLELDAHQDPLTLLGNRRELVRCWPALVQDAAASVEPIALAMIDVDHFKQINDRFGHMVGDQVLIVLGSMLQASARTGDLVIRLGGEEFVIVLRNADTSRALRVCERLREAVSHRDWSALSDGLSVTVSAGVASSPPCELETMMARADKALYAAKQAGRNRSCVG